MQKSRFGGLEIRAKLSLESNLGQLLTLSCLVGVQVGAKRGKSTLLGGLRGTKFELKGALRGPLEALREPKRATATIGGGSTGVIFGLGGPPKVT